MVRYKKVRPEKSEDQKNCRNHKALAQGKKQGVIMTENKEENVSKIDEKRPGTTDAPKPLASETGEPEKKIEKKEADEKEKKEPEKKEQIKEAAAEKKEEPKKEVKPIDVKVFTIPLRKAFRKSRGKRTSYAVKLIKEFLRRHLKMKPKDDKTIKLGKYLNEKLWERGIKKPPRRVRVNVALVGNEYRVELVGKKYEEFRAKPGKKREGMAEKLAARLGGKALQKEAEKKMIEGKKDKQKKSINTASTEKNNG